MYMQDLSKIISAGAGPIIGISACGLLCLAHYGRLTAVVTWLRSFHRERLRAQQAIGHQRASNQLDQVALLMNQEVLEALETQTTPVIRRALSCLFLTIACLSLCSLAVGLIVV